MSDKALAAYIAGLGVGIMLAVTFSLSYPVTDNTVGFYTGTALVLILLSFVIDRWAQR